MSTQQAVVPALGRLWFNSLTERCAKEGVTLPGGENLHQKFSLSDVPVGARGKLAQVMHVEWVKGRTDVPAWQLQALVEAIEAWWQALPEGTTPLGAGLAPAWVRAQGALGHIEPLAQAATRWRAERGGPAPPKGAGGRQRPYWPGEGGGGNQPPRCCNACRPGSSACRRTSGVPRPTAGWHR